MLQDDFIEAVVQHDWPGNVRQLFDVVERCVSTTDCSERCSADTLAQVLERRPAQDGHSAAGLEGTPDPLELKAALEECNWNISKVARKYGWHRKQLYRLAARWGLDLRGKGRQSRWFHFSRKKQLTNQEVGRHE